MPVKVVPAGAVTANRGVIGFMFRLLLDGEFINDEVFVGLSRFQDHGWKLGLVGRIGKMLWLHAKAVAELINPAVFAFQSPIKKIAGIELQTRFGGEDFEHAPAGWFVDSGHACEFANLFVENPVMIVTFAELQLFVILIDA